MDDVLSKPLAVPALTAMIKKFWDTCDEEESTMTSVDSAKTQTILDTAMLEQYIDLVGPKLITDGGRVRKNDAGLSERARIQPDGA